MALQVSVGQALIVLAIAISVVCMSFFQRDSPSSEKSHLVIAVLDNPQPLLPPAGELPWTTPMGRLSSPICFDAH